MNVAQQVVGADNIRVSLRHAACVGTEYFGGGEAWLGYHSFVSGLRSKQRAFARRGCCGSTPAFGLIMISNKTKHPALKNHRHYIFYRVYTVVVGLIWNAAFIFSFFQKEEPDRFLSTFLILLPFVIPAIIMAGSFLAFPFDYSIFGKFERSHLPNEPVLESAYGGKVGNWSASWPFITWKLYASGLGVSVSGSGEAFIPIAAITGMKKSFIKGRVILHNSPEVRSPLVVTNDRIYNRLAEICLSTGSAIDVIQT